MRDVDYDCVTHGVCSDPFISPLWILIVVILLIVLVLAIANSKTPDSPETKVDKVLKDYQEQAQSWKNPEAAGAFGAARIKIAEILRKRE